MKLRVIVDGPRDPRLNMALDESILSSVSETPTLRIYMWLPTGVSLGRRQQAAKAVNIEKVKEKGYVLVRRPTGGATLIHAEGMEVTYSLTLPNTHPLYSLSVEESASLIAKGLANALKILGLDARVGGFSGVREENLCYLRIGSSDVTINGLKVSGSAQVRTGRGLLQHGTLLLDINYDDWIEVIRTNYSKKDLANMVTGLKRLGLKTDLPEVIDALVKGFSSTLKAEPVYSSMKPTEINRAYILLKEKYMRNEWNLEGNYPKAAVIT